MRKRKFTFLIIAIVMIIALLAAVVACEPDTSQTEEESYSNTLVTNGNFDSASGESQPMTPSGWTGEAGSTSSSAQYKTPVDNVHAGVIDVTNERGYRSEFGSISPGKAGEDNNILAIYNNVEASSYKYTSSSITLSSDSVYRLSVWVKTNIFSDTTYYSDWLNRNENETQDFDDDTTGAYVYVNGVAYAAFEAINTNGEWQELVVYIDTHNSTGGSITIILSLGTGNYSSGHMAAGYAFFDNITLINLNEEYADSDSEFVDGDSSISEADADAKAVTDFNSAIAGTSTSNIVNGTASETSHKVHTYKYDMGSGDIEFDYATKTSEPYSSSRWTGSAGTKTDGTSFGTTSTNLQRGVLDTANMDVSVINDASEYENLTLDSHGSVTYSYSDDHERTVSNILYIQARNANVYGYSSNTTYTIEANNYYKVSVWVKTYMLSGKGAAIRLTTGDDDESVVSISDINTNGAWTEYSLYLQGNQYRDNTVTLELWLGENNTAGSEGIAFFDSVSVSNIDKDIYDAAAGDNIAKDDLLTMEGENTSLTYEVSKKASSSNALLATVGESVDGITVDKALAGGSDKVWVINNPVPGYASISPVVNVNSASGTVDTSNLIPLAPNSYIAVSVWVKTSDIVSGGLGVTLYNYNVADIKEMIEQAPDTDFSDLSSYRSSVASLSSLTSESLEDYKIDGVNDYVMLTFMVQGGKSESYLGFEFTLGTGSATNSSSYVKGYALISNIMTESLSAADYSAANTASNVAKGSISTDTTEVEIASNGFFNVSDISGTNSLYSTDDNDFDFNNSNTNGVLALPDGWSATDSSLLTAYNNDTSANNYAFGGVLELDSLSSAESSADKYLELIGNGSLYALLSGNKDDIFASADKYSGLSANNNVLALYSHRLAAFGFSSDEFSLSSNSYYRVSVWAYAEPGSQISIVISTGSDDTEYDFFETPSQAGWKEYVFYIQTGVSSVSASMSLYVGNAGYDGTNTSDSNYAALFTGASYQSITEEDFNAYVSLNRENAQTLSMLVNTMDNVTANSDSLNSPSDWSASKLDSDASDDDVSAGVFDRQNHDWDELLDLDIAGDDAALNEAIYNSGAVDVNINNSDITTGIGDMVLVIYNHDDVLDDDGNLSGGAYSYISSDLTLTAGKYYKITVWVLTYKLGADDSARIVLKLGNSTYTFGASVDDDSTAVEKARLVNTSTYAEDGTETVGRWQEISFYVYIDEDVTENVTGSLTVQLGAVDEWVSGYAFFDNFSCVEIASAADGETTVTPAQIVSGKVGFDVVYTDESDSANNNVFSDANGYNKDGTIKEGANLATNYIVHYTQADAESTPEEEEPTDEGGTDSLLWLYIVSGIIGGLIVIAVIVVLARKVFSKRKRQKQVSKKSDFDRNYTGRSNARKK